MAESVQDQKALSLSNSNQPKTTGVKAPSAAAELPKYQTYEFPEDVCVDSIVYVVRATQFKLQLLSACRTIVHVTGLLVDPTKNIGLGLVPEEVVAMRSNTPSWRAPLPSR